MGTEHGGRLGVAVPGERWDPVAATATLVGRKWHTVVVHRLLEGGPLGFSELERSVEGLSNKVLSECLDDLEAKGLVARRVVSERPLRVEYALTGAGETLEPVIAAMVEWGERAVERAATREEADVSVPR